MDANQQRLSNASQSDILQLKMENSRGTLDPLKQSRDSSHRMFGLVSKSIDKRAVDHNIEKSEILNGKGAYID